MEITHDLPFGLKSQLTPWILLSLPFLSLLVFVVHNLFFSPLAKIPGPFLPRLTRWWLAYHGWQGDFHDVLSELHEKYGPVVRTGPNEVLTTSPEAVKKIYNSPH